MKKVCIFNLNVYCLFNPKSKAPMGGAELDMYTLSTGLAKDFDVSVITGDWGQNNIETTNGIQIVKSFSLEKNILNLLKAPFILFNTLDKVNSDIYISSGAGIEVGIIALFCYLKNKKYIYRTASAIDCDFSYVKSNWIAGLIYNYGLKSAHRIITSVKHHKLLLKKNYPKFEDKKLQHINLAIQLQKTSSNKKYILWVSRCEKYKNPDILLEIAKSLPNTSFVMICPKQKHNPKFFYKIKNMAHKLPNVEFINYVPFNKIQPYFDKAKVFINTSDYEGFTYTLIQSGLAHTPVVYLNVNPDKVISKFNLGYVAGGNITKMIKQIKDLLDNPENLLEKSNNSYEYVKQNHDIKAVIKKWKHLLQTL